MSTKSNVDHENEFLYTFFTYVTQLCFDKAKELVDKEREPCRSVQMGPWGMLLMHLPQVAAAERSYADLGFLHTKNKGFLRKDNSLKTTYESLKSDLKRVEEVSIGTSVAEISNQLCQFISARIQLIEFYEKMYNMSTSNKLMKYRDLLVLIEVIVESHSLSCTHFSLSTIKASLTLESEVLMQLIRAHIEIQHWRFLPSLMALYGVQARMLAWERTLQSKESWKLGFGASFLKSNQLPALYQWLVKFKSAMVAKFSFYFYTILSQQTNLGELRSILSKQNVDYHHKLQNVQKKLDVFAIIVVFDTRSLQDSGLGYRHPKRETESQERFQIVLTIPTFQSLTSHWDNIMKFIEQRYADLIVMDKVVFNKNQNDMWTYAMYNIEPRMTFVIAYENFTKQKDKDSHVATFILDLNAQMRCNKIFESLKPSK